MDTATVQERLAAHKAWVDRGLTGDGRLVEEGSALKGADLSGADLWHADLTGADLSRTNLKGANLHSAYMSGANLLGANLEGADLTGANLKHANLSGACLLRAKTKGANLSGALLSGCFGVLWWSVGENGPGRMELGSALVAVDHGDGEVVVYHGCFRGTLEELEASIDRGEKFRDPVDTKAHRRAARVLRELIEGVE